MPFLTHEYDVMSDTWNHTRCVESCYITRGNPRVAWKVAILPVHYYLGRTGVTLQLIELIIQKCEHIKSASDMFTNFEIWDMQHALSLYKIISDVCDH